MRVDLFGETPVTRAIKRLRTFEPPEGYYLAFSGGKDSVCIKALADLAGVKYDAHYSVTTVDPPELLRFIREHHADVAWERPRQTMWRAVLNHGAPPTRLMRYCCEEFKERGGDGRLVVTGIRWAESTNRAKRSMTEACYKGSKHYLHPIIDWINEDVWAFIRERGLAYCSLYDEGFERLGCIMCPLSRRRKQLIDAERWPRFYQLWLRAFDEMVKHWAARGKPRRWADGRAVMDWWLNEQDGHGEDDRQGELALGVYDG